MVATTFLTVLILALALGNVFLSVASPQRLQKLAKESPKRQKQGLDSSQTSLQNSLSQESESQAMSFEEQAEKEKIGYLYKRIDRLEQLLLKLDSSKFVAQKINGTNLGQRLQEFDEFKQNTKLEIAALKQRFDKMQPVKKSNEKKASEISDEKLRDLVFRASN